MRQMLLAPTIRALTSDSFVLDWGMTAAVVLVTGDGRKPSCAPFDLVMQECEFWPGELPEKVGEVNPMCHVTPDRGRSMFCVTKPETEIPIGVAIFM